MQEQLIKTIAGKTVEFNIEVERHLLPSFNDSMHKFLGENLPQVKPEFQALREYHIIKDTTGFFKEMTRIIICYFIIELSKEPGFITSDNFKINIKLVYDNSEMGYNYEISSPYEANILIDIDFVFNCILKGNENKIAEGVYHEFVHHLDREKIIETNLVQRRIIDIASKEGAISTNSALIVGILNILRREGISTFETKLKKYKSLLIDKRLYNILTSVLEEICIQFKLKKVGRIKLEISSGLLHFLGSDMVAVIVLSHLFKKGKEFSISIIPFNSWGTLENKKYYGPEFKNFYRNEDFIIQLEDIKVMGIIEDILAHLKKTSHLQFLKEYDNACKYLGVKPFFTPEIYNYYKKKCITNFQKFKQRGGFFAKFKHIFGFG